MANQALAANQALMANQALAANQAPMADEAPTADQAEAAGAAAEAADTAEAEAEPAAAEDHLIVFQREVEKLLMWAQYVPLPLMKRCTRSPAAAILPPRERALPR